jgi:hypothetical protein
LGIDPSFASFTPAAQSLAHTLSQTQEEAAAALSKTKRSMKEQADKHMSQKTYDTGDQVWLDAKHLHSTRPSHKLDFLCYGLFKVIKKVRTTSYWLDLPPMWKIHNVVHMSLLSPFTGPTFDIQCLLPPPEPVVYDNEQPEYKVEAILRHKGPCNKWQYLVHWKGYCYSTTIHIL